MEYLLFPTMKPSFLSILKPDRDANKKPTEAIKYLTKFLLPILSFIFTPPFDVIAQMCFSIQFCKPNHIIIKATCPDKLIIPIKSGNMPTP